MSRISYRFGDFELDAKTPALYYRGELVRNVGQKSLAVLTLLVERSQMVVSHEEIINQVWSENPFGVTSANIAQNIKELRKAFAKYEPDGKFIENAKRRGYIFTADIEEAGNSVLETVEVVHPHLITQNEKTDVYGSRRNLVRTGYLVLGVSVVVFVLSTALIWYPRSEEDEVRRVVKDSQLFESLVLYKNPSAFKEGDLDKYWLAGLDGSLNSDRQRIAEATQKLVVDGKRYGDETKCERFEFQAVEINRAGDYAVVKTLEKWFIAVYQSDGTLLKNKNVGPYFVSYILRKVDGRWLIEKSTTARVSRPTPQLAGIEAVSEMKAGQQFLVRITGQDFEAETVYVEVIGEGCPESKPCKVPNSALRENSKLTETLLDNVPLTLASGDFRISAYNGESKPSNPVYLKVP